MRCGRKIGTRVPIRRNSMCGIERNRLKDALEFVVAENQGVAAGEKDVAHLSMFFQIAKRFFEIGVELLLAYPAHKPASGAVPAIARAAVRHQKEYTIRIPVYQSRHRHVGVLATWVGHVIGRRPCFFDSRDYLAPNRAIRVVALDQVEKMWRNGERKLRPGKQYATPFFIR